FAQGIEENVASQFGLDSSTKRCLFQSLSCACPDFDHSLYDRGTWQVLKFFLGLDIDGLQRTHGNPKRFLSQFRIIGNINRYICTGPRLIVNHLPLFDQRASSWAYPVANFYNVSWQNLV